MWFYFIINIVYYDDNKKEKSFALVKKSLLFCSIHINWITLSLYYSYRWHDIIGARFTL